MDCCLNCARLEHELLQITCGSETESLDSVVVSLRSAVDTNDIETLAKVANILTKYLESRKQKITETVSVPTPWEIKENDLFKSNCVSSKPERLRNMNSNRNKQYRSLRKSTIFSPVRPLQPRSITTINDTKENSDNSGSQENSEISLGMLHDDTNNETRLFVQKHDLLSQLRQQFNQIDREKLSIEISEDLEEKDLDLDMEEANNGGGSIASQKKKKLTRRSFNRGTKYTPLTNDSKEKRKKRLSDAKKKKENVQPNKQTVDQCSSLDHLRQQFEKVDSERLCIERSIYRSGGCIGGEKFSPVAQAPRSVHITI